MILLTMSVACEQLGEIHAAARAGDVARVRALLDQDPRLVSATETAGWTPLHFAAQGGYEELAELLLDRGANVNARLNQGGGTPLHVAVTTGHDSIVALLLARGAHANAIDANEWTALHRAAIEGNREVAEVLLAKGANVYAWSNTGVTPIDQATSMRHTDFATVLRKRGSATLPTTDSFPRDCLWTSGENDSFSFGCDDGAYRLHLKKPGPVHVLQNFGWGTAEVTAEVDASVESGRGLEPGGALLGLGCLSSRDTGYWAILSTNGAWGIMRYSKEIIQLGGANQGGAITGLTTKNRLRIVCASQGGRSAAVSFFVNGGRVGSVKDESGFVEYTGVVLYADTFPGVVAFGRFAARLPSPEDRN